MIVVLPFSIQDHTLARKLAGWLAKLGPYKEHSLLLVKDSRVTDNHEIAKILGPLFDDVTQTLYPDDGVNTWPFSANRMFNRAAKEIEYSKKPRPWLWLEPDSVPMRKGWLDVLMAEYDNARKPFMGDEVAVADVPLHMSGVGFYPPYISQHAYEAPMATDTAWDVAAAHQIVPRAHFTEAIVHAWRHDAFKDQGDVDNLRRQHPEMVLFHSDKSGTLIDLLQKELSGGDGTAETPAEMPSNTVAKSPRVSMAGSGRSAPPAQILSVAPVALGDRESVELPNQRGGLICDILIKSYPKDYEWLSYCLRGIEKFARGFRTVIVLYPASEKAPEFPSTIDPTWPLWAVKLIPVVEEGDGYMEQQRFKINAHEYTDAPYILHIDSDTIPFAPFTPETFLRDGKPLWLITPYSEIEVPWKAPTEKFMGRTVHFETMRRFPMLIPRALHAEVAAFCLGKHGQTIKDYIRAIPGRDFSEFNVLGSYALTFKHDDFSWLDTALWPTPDLVAKQHWSHGGISPDYYAKLEDMVTGRGQVLETLPPLPATPEKSGEGVGGSPPAAEFPGIHQTKAGWWVIDGDERIGKWVEDEGRLDHDQWLLERILPLVNEGDEVIEVGAYIGDHTIAFLGKNAGVTAFEPNPVAFECLRRNCPGVNAYEVALWNDSGRLKLQVPPDNPGGAHLLESFSTDGVEAIALDSLDIKVLNLMMIDAEGSEVFVLRGAERTINHFHPTLIIEINRFALAVYGYKSQDVFFWLKEHGYEWKPIQPLQVADPPQYDVIATYVPQSQIEGVKTPWVEPNDGQYDGVLADPVEQQRDRIKELAKELAGYCTAPSYTGRVRRALCEAGVFPKDTAARLKKHHKKKR